MQRRRFIGSALLAPFALMFLNGCDKRFHRPGGEHNLGEVQYRLFPKQHIADRSMLLFRDEKGWWVMSTRCTYDGCDLTYQDQVLLCSCCKSAFTHEGKVINGPALDPLPFYEMFYKDKFLYAESGKHVKSDYRFTTPEIERAINKLRERIKKEGILPTDGIPPVLWNGQGAASDVPVERGTGNLGMGEELLKHDDPKP